ncbi:phospholipase [Streptomyces tuirus]|uniref:Phospholipase n=1 Tax=Streptomyces tuirus TaxID=68278 RepID=A0A941J2Z2_9ACTN|nr:phospholipase [Streptomyces tuirus]
MSTGSCSSSPDNPFGFPFSMSCARHDFGYRSYKAAGTYSADKSPLDSAFYEDLERICAAYPGGTKSGCDSTAWTYYQAVKAFG